MDMHYAVCICPICNKEMKSTCHHVKPKRLGGKKVLENKFYVCRGCHDVIDRIKYTNRRCYTESILKMFILLHREFPKYYTKEYINSLLWKAYGITLYEINVYCLVDYIEEYKGDIKHLYNILAIFNQGLPKKQRLIINYYPMLDEIRIDKVSFKMTDAMDRDFISSYSWNDIK